MLAMQEECRLEMMKFYIQSQNPNLFEELYHDVSYPEGVKKEDQASNSDENAQSENPENLPKDIKEENLNNKAEDSTVQEKMSNLELNEKKN
jgi:hypothetical protein